MSKLKAKTLNAPPKLGRKLPPKVKQGKLTPLSAAKINAKANRMLGN